MDNNKNKSKSIVKKILLGFGIALWGLFVLYVLLVLFSPRIEKPIIYLYPEKETEVTVKLKNEGILTHTYPKYKGIWKVLAEPNGDLTDIKTGKKYYGLYWEGKDNKFKVNDMGFVVNGKDTIPFLEEKLEKLGLNEREANEFIIYWLPRLENNKYNYIRFVTTEEMNEIMPLEVNPKPDSMIRVLMLFKSLNKKIRVKEQNITTPERKGFTLVEWGGTEIK